VPEKTLNFSKFSELSANVGTCEGMHMATLNCTKSHHEPVEICINPEDGSKEKL
jgi:hypothetical protein